MWTRKHLTVFLVLASLTASATAAVIVATAPAPRGLLPFLTYGELSSYVTGARQDAAGMSFPGGLLAGPAGGPTASPIAGAPAGPSGPSYSGTNVQVAGVDELDTVKTDGTFLYVASGSRVTVFRAYPATQLTVVSRIDLGNLTVPVTGSNATSAAGLFLNGATLAVVANAYAYAPGIYGGPTPLGAAPVGVAMPVRVSPQETFAFLFDVTDPAHPILEHTLAITGYASTGRMVADTVYLVADQWIPQVNGTVLPPQVCVDTTCRDLAPGEIYRDPESVDAWDYTNLLAIDLDSGAAQPMAIVTGGTSVLYMSPTAMYLAFYKWMLSSPGPLAAVMPIRIGDGWTTIYKLAASGLTIRPVASADVDGTLLNQYSMDEWNGTFRVATTARDFTGNGTSVYSNVYDFDTALRLLGAVKKLAPGESIFAVRFLGDRAYVVTFRRIDPLFVIDLSDPTAPTVSGRLEMPGFSQYLYPLDAGHLVGVGKDALPSETEWSWYEGLKLSLYDVTNGSDPRETSNVSIGDRGTQSEVLQDPHAFLYVPDRQLVVLPVDLAIVDPAQYPGGVPTWAYGTIVWEGAYVYHVDESAGFAYVGRVAHGNGTVNATYGWWGSPTQIHRSLYIGDVLYTVSDTEVLASSLADLSTIGSVVYASPPACPYCVPLL